MIANVSKLFWSQDVNEPSKVCKPFTWIHSDIMDDNIHMEPCNRSCSIGSTKDAHTLDNGSVNGCDNTVERKSWRPSHILDFSNLSLGQFFIKSFSKLRRAYTCIVTSVASLS